MKITITGSVGNISRPLAQILVAEKQWAAKGIMTLLNKGYDKIH